MPNGDGFGFTVAFVKKSKTEKPGGLLAAAILPVFYANALSKAACPTFRSANALLYYPPHFVFALCDCGGIAAAIVNFLSTESNFGLYFVMGVTSRFLNMKKPENFC